MLVVFVPGEPIPTARARTSHGATFTPRTTAEYQSKVARAVRTEVLRSGWPERFAGRVLVSVFVRGESLETDPDNVLKSALDALKKGTAIKDDRFRFVRGASITADADLLVVGMKIQVYRLDPEGGACS